MCALEISGKKTDGNSMEKPEAAYGCDASLGQKPFLQG
jgi:hypothetical protein